MDKTVKTWLIAAAALVALGAILFTCAMFSAGWDLNKLGNVDCSASAPQIIEIDLSTGDIRLEAIEAGGLDLTTDTGDITGTLLSDKVFLTETSTGRISVPKTTTGGKCELKTSTGDIKIDVIS